MSAALASENKQLIGLDEELERSIFESYMGRADKVVVVLDLGFWVKAVNEYGLKVLGLKQEEVVGKAWLAEFVGREGRERVRNDYEQLLRTGTQEPAKNEHRLKTDEGESGVFAWQHFLVKGVGGKARAILSVGEDVTEQKVMEQVLARRNAILEALTLAADKFLLATPDVWEGNVIQVLEHLGEARGSERIYVCKNRKMKDGRIATFLKYEWKADGENKVFKGSEEGYKVYEEVGLARWKQLLLQNEVMCEEVVGLPNEERQWNISLRARSVVVVPVFVGEEWWGYVLFEDWEEGRECSPSELEALKAVALTFGQAIRRKRMEEELTREKTSVEKKVLERTKELEEAKEKIQEGLWHQQEEKARLTASIHSLSLGFVMTDTQKNVLLFNHAVNDILGKVNKPWDWGLLIKRLTGVFELEKQYDECLATGQEMVVGEVEDGQRFLRFYLTPIKLIEGDGRVIGVVMLIEDVTEEKRLQVARDEFFAVASHELRTPLSSIRGNASVIMDYFKEKVGDEALMGIVEDIYGSSVRLISIVNEFLDISRAEVGKVEMKKERFNVVEEVRHVMQELKANAAEKGLAWELQLPEGEVWWVWADKDRTRQVLFNLLGNALKFTAKGGVYVKVTGEGLGVKVKVYDTGAGIAEEDRMALFEKFKQFGDRVYSQDVTQGTGMGLYISRLIMEAMDGKVYLEGSEVGRGSCFVMEMGRG